MTSKNEFRQNSDTDISESNAKGKFNREKAIKLGIPVGPLFSKLQNGESIKLQGKTIKPEIRRTEIKRIKII